MLDKLSIAKGLKNLFLYHLARRRLPPSWREKIIGLRYRLVFATSKWDFQFVYGYSKTLCNDSQCLVIATLYCHPKSALRIWKPKEKKDGVECAWVKIEWSSEIDLHSLWKSKAGLRNDHEHTSTIINRGEFIIKKVCAIDKTANERWSIVCNFQRFVGSAYILRGLFNEKHFYDYNNTSGRGRRSFGHGR